MRNVFTVDVEDWYHSNFRSLHESSATVFPSILDESIERLIAMFDEARVRATFFILGEVAAKFPHLVRVIAQRGHEIASHGYTHDRVDEMGRSRFRAELRQSVGVLEAVSGRRVLGFRAPSWSIGENTSWIYDELAEAGLRYDASVMPFKTYLYGFPGAPRTAFRAESGILEFPATTYPVAGKNLPFAGGFYLRALPLWLVRHGIRSLNKRGERCTFYIHPREICPRQPRIRLAPKDHLVFYWGLQGVEGKIRSLLGEFDFTSFESVLEEESRSLSSVVR